MVAANQDINAVRPWLAHYPSEVPQEIDVVRLPTVSALILQACKTYADKPAFESFGKKSTSNSKFCNEGAFRYGQCH